jgi:integrase/recombinase XerC
MDGCLRKVLKYQLFRAKKKGSGKFYPKWRIRYLEGRKSLFSESGYTDKGKTQERAQERLRELEKERHEKAMGMAVTSEEPIQTLITQYLARLAEKGGKQKMPASPQHVVNARAKLAYWVKALKLSTLSDIRRLDVEAAQAKIPHTPQTRDLYTQQLKAFTRWCFRNDLLGRDPLVGIAKHAPIPTFKRRALTLSEIRGLLAATTDRRALIYKLALLTGMRRGELDSLTVGSVDWEGQKVHLEARHAKNRKAADFPLPKTFLDELYAFSAGRRLNEKLLVNVSPSKSARTLHRDLNRAGIPIETPEGRVDFHSLRATFLTLINDLGEDAKTVQALGRHADPRLTFDKYVKQKEERLRGVVTRLSEALPETNSDIPRLGLRHTRVTSGGGEGLDPIGTGAAGQGQASRYAADPPKDKARHSRTIPDIKRAKSLARQAFRVGDNRDIPGQTGTEDVSHRRHTLLAQVSEVLSRLTAADLEALLATLQSLKKSGAA